MRIAAIGFATTREIEKHSLKVDFIPTKANSDALAEELIKREGLESVNILVITGNQNRDNLIQRLESDKARAIVDKLCVYRTKKTKLSKSHSAKYYCQYGADAILFTSSSTVYAFTDQISNLRLEPTARIPKYGSIGPITTKTLKSLKLPVAFESPKTNIEDFVVETITNLVNK